MPSFLPESWQAFIARRLMDIIGGAFALCGLSFLVALASYNHMDPSWNTAAGMGTVANWLGLPGAWTADLFLQTLGLGAALFGLTFIAWGTRIVLRHPLNPLWARIISAIIAALLCAAALSRLPSGGWLPHAWLGGSGGTLILNHVSGALHGFTGASAYGIAAAGTGILGALIWLHALAVTRYEIAAAASFLWRGIVTAASFALAMTRSFIEWIRHYNNPDYAPRRREPRIERGAAAEKTRRAPRLTKDDEDSEDSGEEETAAPPAETGLRALRVVTPKKQKENTTPKRQTSFALDTGDWELPPADLLQEAPQELDGDLDENALRQNASMLQSVLGDFNVTGDIVSIHPGPVVTLYELEPAPGTKTSRVIGLSDDIARSMAAVSVRCAVVPGRNVIGIELPNTRRQTVYMRSVLESAEARKTNAALPLVLGKDIGGHPIVADLAKMPHLLVAGTTGSGKSVAVNTMILSLLYRLPPEKCRFIMIDPKMLELSVYDDIPHLLAPVVTEPGKAVVSLKWAVQEMEDRYRAMSKLGVRNIEGYNERLRQARKKGETLMRKVQTGFDPDTGKPVYEEQPLDMTELPYIVVIVDEFADLMLVAGKDVENAVQRLAQMARAAGIHLIMATQRPSVDVITGVIKANFPTRISFQVTSKVDSRTILNEGGAEQLLGMGDMLYMAGGGRISRVHGPFVSDAEVESVVNFLKAQGEPAYIDDVTEGGNFGDSEIMGALFGEGDSSSGGDELYNQAVAIVARERKASTSFIQRHLQIGYNRAARIIEEMERQGVVTPANRVGKREVLVSDFSDA
ncbi:MAG: DNA translocase FtsK 4TM domain-containing protein [Proteobacteria bacterium]|nr:DNA translocase FtsK 4TM domain-containing protein [Pseudomonadota bacterium]